MPGKTAREQIPQIFYIINDNKPNRYRERRFTNKFRKMVLDLEDEMEVLELCYKKNQVYEDILGHITDILGHLKPLYTDILISSD